MTSIADVQHVGYIVGTPTAITLRTIRCPEAMLNRIRMASVGSVNARICVSPGKMDAVLRGALLDEMPPLYVQVISPLVAITIHKRQHCELQVTDGITKATIRFTPESISLLAHDTLQEFAIVLLIGYRVIRHSANRAGMLEVEVAQFCGSVPDLIRPRIYQWLLAGQNARVANAERRSKEREAFKEREA